MNESSRREVWLLRHAKARPAASGQADLDRPLAGRGLEQCRRIEQWLRPRLAETRFTLLVSPAVRTRQTAEHIFGAWCPVTPEPEDAIWNAGSAALLRVLENHPGNLVLVGHNPGLEQLQYLLTGHLRPLPTGGLFRLGLGTEGGPGAILLESFQPATDST